MRPRILLRAEGLVVFAAASGWFVLRDGSFALYLLAVLLPDVSMAGYLVSRQVGSMTYNAVHAYPLPALVLVGSLYAGASLGALLALVWFAHIGLDRLLGYGLKYPHGTFGDTHLGRV